MQKIITLLLFSFISLAVHCVSGCSTVKGFGKDVSKGGRDIQRAAS
jgi:predicted small secreted protein